VAVKRVIFVVVVCVALVGAVLSASATGRSAAGQSRRLAAVASGAPASAVRVITVAVAAPRVGERIYAPRFRRRVLRYRWLRCNRAGRACVRIRGATRRSYVIRAADLGHRLRSYVVLGSGVAVSAPTAVVGAATPVNTALPVITDGGPGTVAAPISGDALSGSNGTWKHAVRFTYQWEHCTTASPPVCTAIANATTNAYTIQDTDVGFTIAFQVTAFNS
jgi:hypothetical protein